MEGTIVEFNKNTKKKFMKSGKWKNRMIYVKIVA